MIVDACSDRTAAIAAADLDPACDLLLHSEHGSAGKSRRLGVAAALRRTPVDPSRVWVCSTDADSTVPVDWFDVHLEAARDGHIAIAGVVELDDAADPRLLAQFESTYLTNPDGTHPHIHAANLGFRADAYVLAGGWAPLPTGEDRDLWQRLAPHGGMLAVRSPLGHDREQADRPCPCRIRREPARPDARRGASGMTEVRGLVLEARCSPTQAQGTPLNVSPG